MRFPPPFTCILLHDWYHELKITSLLVFKLSCDRKATFLSFLLTLSVRKAPESRKTTWKQLITRPITNLMRQQTKQSLWTCVWTVYQKISCTPAVSSSKLRGTEVGGQVLKEHCTNQSKWASLIFPSFHHFPLFFHRFSRQNWSPCQHTCSFLMAW